MKALNIITLILVLIGGINWGLIGIFDWNLVDAIFGAMSIGSAIVYVLVGISALWLVVNAITSRGRVMLTE